MPALMIDFYLGPVPEYYACRPHSEVFSTEPHATVAFKTLLNRATGLNVLQDDKFLVWRV